MCEQMCIKETVKFSVSALTCESDDCLNVKALAATYVRVCYKSVNKYYTGTCKCTCTYILVHIYI